MHTDDKAVDNERTRAVVPHGNTDELPLPDVVTSVIQHRVHVGAQARYETWLREITPAAISRRSWPRVTGRE